MKLDKSKLSLDVHSKTWWTSVIALVIVLVQQVAHLFGWTIPAGTLNDLTGLANTVLALAGMAGLIYDTSKGGKA